VKTIPEPAGLDFHIHRYIRLSPVFSGLCFERFRMPEIFAASQRLSDPFTGLASALFLLTSSWSIVGAINATRRNAERAAARCLNLTLLLGALFTGNKLIEYSDKFAHGLSPVFNGFFTSYFLINGLHFIYVIGGTCFIGHCPDPVGGGNW
jgi:nitric oxide reductase NorE protein